MKKFAIILAGSGVYDGAEIHEATLSMLAIKQQGADYDIFAPNIEQYHVINHKTGEEMNEKRNVLIESARIARGNISDLKDFHPENYDALLFPGGFGVAKNLCTFAFEGTNCSINEEVEKAIQNTAKLAKPIGALCISPVLIAIVLADAKLTIGQDEATASAINSFGGTHINTKHGEVIHDTKNNVFTTPCYMLDATIVDINEGAQNIVKAMLEVM